MPRKVVVIGICSLCGHEVPDGQINFDVPLSFRKIDYAIDICDACESENDDFIGLMRILGVAEIVKKAKPDGVRRRNNTFDWTCPHCGLFFAQTTGQGKSAHLRSVHPEKAKLPEAQQVFTCEDCGKEFANNYAVAAHRRVHKKKESR